MNAFLISLAMIFLAELGDKTQLVALALATRYNAKVVLWGIFCATLTVHIASTAIGWWVGELLPTQWIQFLAGLAFIIFGLWTLRGDCLDEQTGERCRSVHPFQLVFITFSLAELGDKTMLGTVTLAATNPFIPVWIGSTLGMVLADGLAIVIGKMLGAKLPERIITIGAAVVFFGFGTISLIQGGLALPGWVWPLGLSGCALFGYAFFKPLFKKERSPIPVEEKEAS